MSRRRKWFFIILVVVLFLVVLIAVAPKPIMPDSVLVLEIGGQIEDQRPPDAWARLTEPPVTPTHEILDAIDTAANDSRISGLVVKINPSSAGWAKLEEIRRHLERFRQSNKTNICYLSGDMPGNREYFLATGCEKLWLMPTSALGTVGLMASSTFYKGTLEKLGVEPNVYGTGDYKTYRNQFTEKKYTPAHRESVESLVDSIYRRYVELAARARKLEAADFDALLRNGPYLPQEAAENKLIDEVAYWDEVEEHFRDALGDWQPVHLARYKLEFANDGAETIAVVNATGSIEMGDSGYDSWEGFVMGGDSVAEDLRRARQDDSVKAIVLRVDSPGGSSVASEVIRREVALAREEKPVVVSMADTAASGGYWISMSASKIVAEPATITGSIGVVFGKLNVAGLYRLLGLSTDHYATSENATFLYEQQNFTPEQRRIIDRFMQDTYDTFMQGVAEGRSLPVEEVEKLAAGRVWTGAQAKERGLLDEFGGLDRAIELARELAGIDPSAKVRIERLPKERGLFEQLLSRAEPAASRADALARKLRQAMQGRSSIEVRLPFEIQVR